MEEIKEKLRAFIQEKFEIDDDPDFTDNGFFHSDNLRFAE